MSSARRRRARPLEPHGRPLPDRLRACWPSSSARRWAASSSSSAAAATTAAWPGRTWKPDGSSFVKTRQIASVVGSQYRLPSGQQLVAVIPRIPPAVEPSTQETPISHIALAQSSAPRGHQGLRHAEQRRVRPVRCRLTRRTVRHRRGEGDHPARAPAPPRVARARAVHVQVRGRRRLGRRRCSRRARAPIRPSPPSSRRTTSRRSSTIR